MDLMTAQDWTDFRTAIHDVTDTFFKLPVTYIQRRIHTLYGFNENRGKNEQQFAYVLNSLLVPEDHDRNRAQVQQDRKGFADLSEGYLYFSFPDLRDFSPSMIDSNGRPVFVANKDSFIMQGKEVTIIGINLVGPSQTDFQLVKVHYKQELNSSPLAPINTVLPVATRYSTFVDLFSDTFLGTKLKVTNGTWTSTGSITYTYQWKRDSVNIAGAIANKYSLVDADHGHSLTCLVTATNAAGSSFIITAPIAIT